MMLKRVRDYEDDLFFAYMAFCDLMPRMYFEQDNFGDPLNQAWRRAMYKVADASNEVESLLGMLEAKAGLDPAEQAAKRKEERR